MKIIKCGRFEDHDYCIVRLKYSTLSGIQFSTFELFVDITKEEDGLKKWFISHRSDSAYNFNGVSKGVISVGMNGKPKTKFRDRCFARFGIETREQNEVLDNVENYIKRFNEFKIMATLEGFNIEEKEEENENSN